MKQRNSVLSLWEKLFKFDRTSEQFLVKSLNACCGVIKRQHLVKKGSQKEKKEVVEAQSAKFSPKSLGKENGKRTRKGLGHLPTSP